MIAELGLTLALATAPAVQAAPSPEEIQRRFWEERLVRAGFAPLQPAGPFRRVMLSDPYGMLPIPGLELRRRASGEVDLVLQYPEWRSEPIAVDPALWNGFSTEGLFPPAPARAATAPPPPSGPPPPPPPPPPICHGWSAVIQDETGRLANWHACAGETTPVADFAERLVTAAVATKPDCAADPASPFFAFQRCFGRGPALEDPELEAVFEPLRRERAAVSGALILAAARRSLQAQGMRRGDAAWSIAQRDVQAVRATHEQLRDISRRLAQLSFQSPHARADRYMMSRTLEHWTDFADSQDRNYIELLEQLLAVEP